MTKITNRLKSLPKPIAYPIWAVIALILFILIYVIIMATATLLPSQFANHHINNDEQVIDIYVISNGVHTDFALPTKTDTHDWTSTFDPMHTNNKQADNWIFIGWGDRDFYLNTPTWSDLKASTALNALSGLSGSAIHISYKPNLTVQSCQKCRKITISNAQYQILIAHILQSLPNEHKAITNAHYWGNDAFYPAVGSYNLFYTCNSWVNNGLKKADIKTALWTVTDFGVVKER